MAASDVEDPRSRSGSPDESELQEDMSEPPQEGKKSKPANGASNAKDPNRPRRKKARRACFACQRAHLTCGDERPCQRCIKRGLQDACQDGVRKKAKYLHDAPNEALMPGVGATMYTHPAAKRASTTTNPHDSQQQSQPQGNSQQYFPPSQNFNMFTPSQQMPPPMLQERSMSSSNMMQQSPLNTTFNISTQPPMQSPTVEHTNQGMQPQGWSGMAGALFNDPSAFNFDIASMNFTNQYGALEFGMLGQMATNAGDTPPSESGTTRGSVHQNYRVPLGSFSESPNNTSFPYNDPAMMSDWSNGSGVYHAQMGGGQPQAPHAFAIETNAQFHSPENHQTPPDGLKFEESPLLTSAHLKPPVENNMSQPLQRPQVSPQKQRQPTQITTPQLKAKTALPAKPSSKRPRDPSTIYTSVTTPHPYTQNFHHLIAYLQRRFSSQHSKTLSIAKSLASIRPSFIATTKTLNRDDLIFMEKCFQRTLFEYESFIEGVGTPTIVARRTGEVAAVGKEFQILTGWSKSVLLGRAPNLNVNRGHTGLTPQTGSGANSASASYGNTKGFNTPQRTTVTEEANGQNGEKRDRPVFLAELLDDDSVVQFYEDFARLAFGDSRGSVFRKGKLLKYRTREDEVAAELRKEAAQRQSDGTGADAGGDDQVGSMGGPVGGGGQGPQRRDTTSGGVNPKLRKEGISGEKGMQKLGSADGKVDCAYCWTVKRDVFDIPMLLVMNVSTSPSFPS
ncbi:uncharacterized protein HMPREF1541_06157 [Cyphellophora europaea CBS 101466]|uniref:Zn(2)-C6 fungal-type domain-containing protein n=1 Tax=Cyphellophora europaea (strain CBS 101466) TaxID=1220924 RepID=W2RUF9_CYPE1|nr:uncharacterized protein HMPREF1541_06157 [Cyphellophora europaea CBS 101466]ETN39930.1 hypothetical protein HMPREF1541_06157 [Cyphellophora europaea CBS 101466]